jgi:hypothetical protein
MKPFRPNSKQTLKSYYEVPVEILEEAELLTLWAGWAIPYDDAANRIALPPARHPSTSRRH